ncbi:hypothetical protein ES332_A01G131600v1 [Gossypium tomentosum]|uniref:Uncharacterized protein n=1 Tax=Gossypium tomentosum TaxID=34277 RepID=A0A5D2RQ41_GOSTO|nr:hypothetical protein ES332_A01G131600v1 [Gossypium tomentosum]
MDPIAKTTTNLPTTVDATTKKANVAVVTVLVLMLHIFSYAKPILDISKIEASDGTNFKSWGEHIFSILDMHKVGFTFTECDPTGSSYKQLELLVHANKVCRHTIISTLSNELFDV